MAVMSVDELGDRLGDPTLRIVDTRWYLLKPGAGRAAYDEGHIPGAIFLDLDVDLSASDGPGRHPLPTPAVFEAHMTAAGIGDDNTVVAYDDSGGQIAARLWWMLDNLGHEHAFVLDGGLAAWTESGRELSTDVPSWPPGSLTLRGEWHGIIDRAAVEARLGDVTLLDARAPERYRGEVEPIDPAAGHIPTAVSAPATANLDPFGRLLPAAQLNERFQPLASDGREVITYCGSGTTACHNVLAMRLAGLSDPTLYVGSFSDWSRSGMPVATGDRP